MSEFWYAGALIFSLLALAAVLVRVQRWSLIARIQTRLNRNKLNNGVQRLSTFQRFADRFTNSKMVRSEYSELREAMEKSGRTPQQAQKRYIYTCWLIPTVIITAAFIWLDILSAIFVAAFLFVVPRRIIHSQAETSEKQQNLESIQLCQLTRMLMEAGLSLEKSLRFVHLHAESLIPALMPKISRYNRMMESGADRSIALNELGENKRISVLKNYTSLMKQSGHLGSKVSDSLLLIIKDALHVEMNQIKEETNKLSAKMTIIMMAFMLPSLFILIGGPALLSIAEMLKGH